MIAAPFPDRDAVADKLATFGEAEQAFIKLLMENPIQDENLMEGLLAWLNKAATAPFLNALKIYRTGEWLGSQAPARLQMRLMELAKSSHHGAFEAFRDGLSQSKGLERAFPKA
jgi:hypothetical protein